MKCPFCSHDESKVVDKREANESKENRRRRECLNCKKRFTTRERAESVITKVVKRDGKIVESIRARHLVPQGYRPIQSYERVQVADPNRHFFLLPYV